MPPDNTCPKHPLENIRWTCAECGVPLCPQCSPVAVQGKVVCPLCLNKENKEEKPAGTVTKNKLSCPQCGENIPYAQIFKHTFWTPVICKNCGAQLHYNKKEWFAKSAPFLVVCIIFLLSQLSGIETHLSNIILLTLLFILSIRLNGSLKTIRLYTKNELLSMDNDSQPASSEPGKQNDSAGLPTKSFLSFLIDNKLWFSLWFSPKKTFNNLLNLPGTKYELLIVSIGALESLLALAANKHLGDTYHWFVILICSILFIPVWLFFYYAFWMVVLWLGQWFKGRANQKRIRTAVIGNSILNIWRLLLLSPLILIFRQDYFVSASPAIDNSFLFMIVSFLDFIMLIWGLIILLLILSTAQEFSIVKSIFSLILSVIVIMILTCPFTLWYFDNYLLPKELQKQASSAVK